MPDTEYDRIFQLARERALAGFTLLVRRIMREADDSLAQAQAETASPADRSALLSARQILSRDAQALQKRSDALFRSYLERATRTMYTDLRPDLMKRSIDELALIDDETVNRQIEVDRLVLRMRNEDEKIIGRLNVIIARLHGDHDARERENPFRPYLLARTLHETVKEVAADEAAARHLFDHLSNALVRNFAAYYAGIAEAFESRGIKAQFTPRLSKPVWNQRYFGGFTMPAEPVAAELTARVLPYMLRMLELMQQAQPAYDPRAAHQPAANAAMLQEFMLNLFAPPNAEGGRGGVNGLPPAPRELVARLSDYQSIAARGEETGPGGNQLFALREKLVPDQAASLDGALIDVVAMLFEFVLGDQKIPAPLRDQLGRLQIPLLKAAMLEPQLLRDAEHPARRLLNRLCSAAVGCDPQTPLGAVIAAEISNAAGRVLADFDADASVFSEALAGFEHGLAARLRDADSQIAACAAALDRAERSSLLLSATSALLTDLLAPLEADARVADFITGTWSRVLVKAFLDDSAGFARYRDLLAGLVWSVQEKHDARERSTLMRLLPDLVKRLKAGLAFIGMSEAESRHALDQLVELHTRAMRAGQPKPAQETHGIDALRRRFSLLKLEEAEAAWADDGACEVPLAAIDDALIEEKALATVRVDAHAARPSDDELRFLSELPLGACMAYPASGGSPESRLVWISPRRRLYLFKPERDAEPLVYTAASLLHEFKHGALRPLEYAPIFERAVASLMRGAESIGVPPARSRGLSSE